MEDCYFFMTATCAKGSQCTFRHCEAAKSSEAICPQWASPTGCANRDCSLRHSVFDVRSRKDIPCYWEAHGGCLKPDCPFRHTNNHPVSTQPEATQPQQQHQQPQQQQQQQQHQPQQQLQQQQQSLPAKPSQPSPARRVMAINQSSQPLPSTHPTTTQSGRTPEESNKLDFEVKSFEEIMREKRRRMGQDHQEEGEATVERSEKSPKISRTVAGLTESVPATVEVEETKQQQPNANDKFDEDDIDRHLAELDELIGS